MARNLSKISAVISVNTSEARQKLAGFAGDAKKYAASLDASFQRTTRSVQQSFEKIFTEQQKVQRQIAAGRQAGVGEDVLRAFGDTKKMEQEANKIAALRKKALGMQTPEGMNAANAEIDKVAAAFTRLNDILVRTGSVSPAALRALSQGIKGAAGAVTVAGKADARLGTRRLIQNEYGTGGTNNFFEAQRLSVATKQLEAYRRILTQVGAEANGPIRQAFNNLVKAQAKAATAPQKDAEKYKKAIEQLRLELEKLIAAEAKRQGGRSRNLRTIGGIRNQVDQASTGSINSQWGTRAGLAIQQLTFAFDDFNSATGGVDAKVRAMGNNISQFGLMVGGTAGLIGGVLVGAMAQLYASYLKHADATNDTAAITRSAAKAEEELTRARSRQAEVMKQLREGLATAGMTEEQKRIFGSEQKGGDYLAAAVEEQRATLMRDDPVLRRSAARVAQLEKQLENPNIGAAERRKIEMRIEEQRGVQEQRLGVLRGDQPQDVMGSFRKLEEFYKKMGGAGGLVGDYLQDTIETIQAAMANGVSGVELEELIAKEVANAVPDPGLLPRTALATDIIKYLDEVSAAATANASRRKLATQEKNAGMIPVFDQAAAELNGTMSDVAKAFGDAVPEQYLATIADLREEMVFIEKQLADGAITAEEAAAEMEQLNAEMANVSAQAKQTAADIASEAKARDLLADMAIDAWNREQAAKEQFYQTSEKFAIDRAMDRVREFNLGARQTDGVSDAEARDETEAMLMREFAPAIMGLLKAQQNALLQGASRRTMDLQDTSTAAGASEFARLVSGEDSARNADLAELRKQSKLLEDIRDQAQQEGII